MKVLVLSNLYPPDFLGGYELGCRQAVEALRHKGHEVRVLCGAPRLPVAAKSGVERTLHLTDVYLPCMQARYHVVTRSLNQARACFVQAFNVHVLLETLDAFGPDVAYVWNLLGLGGLGLMGCLHYLGVPWVWHLMDRVPRDLCHLPGTAAQVELARAVEGYLEGHYLACSERVLDENNDPEPLLRGTVRLVPNWVVGWRPSPRQDYYRGGRLRILSAVAHLCPPKGIDLILRAAALLRRQGLGNFEVNLYGHVKDDSYPRLVRQEGLDDCVRLHGLRRQEELAEVYRSHDVFAFPTWEREPFAFAPLEAAAQGCVPFLTSSCGNSEWLVHQVHCWKIERSAEALAEALADVLRGRIDLGALGRRVESVVWRDFHIDRALPHIEAALAEAAGKRRGRRGSAAEAYHLAVLAEKLTEVLVQEWLAA
jgi:glycosyltransferase involved in cell wall biosynthesis